MRDLSAHDKHELQRVQKELEVKKAEIAEMARAKDKLAAQVGQLEQTISEIQEQVSEWGAEMEGVKIEKLERGGRERQVRNSNKRWNKGYWVRKISIMEKRKVGWREEREKMEEEGWMKKSVEEKKDGEENELEYEDNGWGRPVGRRGIEKDVGRTY